MEQSTIGLHLKNPYDNYVCSYYPDLVLPFSPVSRLALDSSSFAS